MIRPISHLPDFGISWRCIVVRYLITVAVKRTCKCSRNIEPHHISFIIGYFVVIIVICLRNSKGQPHTVLIYHCTIALFVEVVLSSVTINIYIWVCCLCRCWQTEFWWRKKLLLTAKHPTMTSVWHNGTKALSCHVVVKNMVNRCRSATARCCCITVSKYKVAGEFADRSSTGSSGADICIAPIRLKSLVWSECYGKYRISGRALRVFLSIKPKIITWQIVCWTVFYWWSKQESIIGERSVFIPPFYDRGDIPFTSLLLSTAGFENFKICCCWFKARFCVPCYGFLIPTTCYRMYFYCSIRSCIWICVALYLCSIKLCIDNNISAV